MASAIPLELVPHPKAGRTFRASRRARLADVDRDGRVRFDAIARYLQDVSDDDTRDAGYEDPMSWVARRTVVVVDTPLRGGETVELETFCGGLGPRWAERRVSLHGRSGGRAEAATLWVHLDLDTMTAKPLPPQFLTLFGEAAGGRTVSARLRHPAPPEGSSGLQRRPWHVRATDLDVLDHVNNAAYWAVVEEVLAGRPDLRAMALQAEIEFRDPVDAGEHVDLVVEEHEAGFAAWLVRAGGEVAASAVVAGLDQPARS